jgi:hypothetical protein
VMIRDTNIHREDRFERMLAAVACAVLVAGTGLFLIDGFRDRISADAAVPLLLARRMLETRALMPADWYYGNGDFWILGPQLFVLPFVAAWGVAPRALACGNALGLVLLFVAAAALGRAVGARWSTSLIAASVPVALFSHFQREFVVVQLSYGLMAAKLMLTLAAAIVWLRASSTNRIARMLLVAYAVLLGVWTAENPGRPLMYLVLPLAVALAWHAKAASHRAIVLAAATLVALVTGWLARQSLLAHLQMVPGLDAFRFTTSDEWMSHVRWLFGGLRHLYGGDALGDPPAGFVVIVLALLRAAALPAILLIAVRASEPRGEIGARMPLATGAIGFVFVAALLVVGNVMVDPVSDRYLMPSWLLALAGAVFAASTSRSWRWIAVLLVLAFPLGGLVNALGIRHASSATDAAGLPRPPALGGVIAALRDLGVTRGFASHRYANVATVRSGAALELCDVRFKPEPMPARWLDAEACFDPARLANGFFVLLAPDERDGPHVAAITASIGVPSEVHEVDGYAIWLYRSGSASLAWLAR